MFANYITLCITSGITLVFSILSPIHLVPKNVTFICQMSRIGNSNLTGNDFFHIFMFLPFLYPLSLYILRSFLPYYFAIPSNDIHITIFLKPV
jgi:hypothetical protein